MPDVPRTLLSLVVPCYGVELYLPEFIEALDPQLTPDVEVVLVIDGSPDNSAGIATEWRDGTSHRVVVVEQANQGLSGARNAGLAVAQGRWVTFPDPDDVLDSGYIRTVADFLRRPESDAVALVSTNLVFFTATRKGITDDHALRWKFRRGARVVDLLEEPEYIQLSAATAVLRTDRLRDQGLTFDGRVRPNFEDAALIARYLLGEAAPKTAVLPRARYLYRRRADASSLVQTSWARPEKYDDVLRFGHLAVLDEAARRGVVPRWLQNTVLYDLSWYFTKDATVPSETGALTPTQSDTFHALVEAILEHVDPAAVRAFGVTTLPAEVRAAFLAVKGALPDVPELRIGPRDARRGLVRVSYYTAAGTGRPEVRFAVNGCPAEPRSGKRRAVHYLGRRVMDEVIAWLPGNGDVRATVDGATLPRAAGAPGLLATFAPHTPTLRALVDLPRWGLSMLRTDRPRLLAMAASMDASTQSFTASNPSAGRLAALSPKYQGCWLLIDRDTHAGDNAEHLYRHLAAERPDLNTWFVLNRTSRDWERLAAEGFRLIAHGSPSHAAALTQCRELISSQIDHYIVSPTCALWLRRRPWQFTWLQHGVTQLDLSRWLNAKSPSTVVTSTEPERAAFADDGTPYVFTDREVVLTGMPRHDALVRKAQEIAPAERRSVVFMPTWRLGLLGTGAGSGNQRRAAGDFWESSFVDHWFGLMGSARVRDAASRAGLKLVLMPHPNFEGVLSPDRVPPEVRVLTYTDTDVQTVLARASHVVTDYSSNAFDAALIDRPVLYFQFDRDDVLGGRHTGRPGYFDYERDGFGPVALTADDAERALLDLIAGGTSPQAPYADRIASTFTRRDGRACERVIAAIESRNRPLPSPMDGS